MFVTSIEQERQRFFQNGLLEGKQEGLLEGEQKGKIETAKTMLDMGLELSVISEATKLPESQILELRDELASMKK